MSQITALVGARLFDGETVLEDATVVIDGDRISSVGPRAAGTPLPTGARMVDLSGKTLTPGTIDMHTHAREHALPLWLAYGITTVKDVGNTFERILPWRDAERSGQAQLPRIYCCGPLVDGAAPFWPDHSYALASEDDAIRAADDLAAHGVDACKTYMMLPLPLLRTFVARARAHGLSTSSHLGHVSAGDAIDAGVAGVEHTAQSFYTHVVAPELVWHADERRRRGLGAFWANFVRGWAAADMSADRVRRIVERAAAAGLYVNPTLVTLERTVERGRVGIDALDAQPAMNEYAAADRGEWRATHDRFVEGWSRSDYDAAAAALDKVVEFTGELYRGGVRIHCASDSPFAYLIPGSSFHRELQLLAQCGMGALGALKAATSVAARTLGAADIGWIRPGAMADLLVFADDVTTDAARVRSLENVFRRGVQQDRSALLATASGLAH